MTGYVLEEFNGGSIPRFEPLCANLKNKAFSEALTWLDLENLKKDVLPGEMNTNYWLF